MQINSARQAQLQLQNIILERLIANDGWLPFDDFMQLALYTPNLGYYSSSLPKFSILPNNASGDFVTAPEMSPLFAICVAKQVRQILRVTQSNTIWEFGAGSGKLAVQILSYLIDNLGLKPSSLQYHILELSSSLKQRQQQILQQLIAKGVTLKWHTQLPQQIQGVILANELLDAMPVKLIAVKQQQWFERGVALSDKKAEFTKHPWQWQDRPTRLRLPIADEANVDEYVSELHLTAQAFITTLAQKMHNAVAIFIDYGFNQAEYYHPQRNSGTLMCHSLHKADPNPLESVGMKDITSHIDFSAMAIAGQDAGLEIVGYTNQANFLFNCGFAEELIKCKLQERIMAQRLILEHEMGELFKVLALAKDLPLQVQLVGFSNADKTYQL